MIRTRHVAAVCAALLLALAAWPAGAQGLGTVKVGVLEFGTVNWELDVIKHHGLDKERGFELEVQGFASGQATNVALQGEAVDAIVDDYLWVSRQRSDGQMLTFIPFSSTVGALMVPADSGIESLADLKGRKVGVAGGPVDKSWLLLQGLAAKRHGMDLAAEVEPVYGAPPLLNEKALDGELDAVLNYWHFAARLEGKGFEQLVGVEEAISELGVESVPPQLGYVFYQSFADENPELIAAFADASRAAKELLKSDAEWERIRPLTKAEDDATFEALKRRFRDGIIERWGETEQADAAELYGILAELGGEELVGGAVELAPGTFASGVTY
ncbi:MAG TPA: ABC transporter substrate-binding protein [Geminicoccaceae bacterium]|nr:ABC transporter substrate-binding protein [Geminicoccaceae bacterium]